MDGVIVGDCFPAAAVSDCLCPCCVVGCFTEPYLLSMLITYIEQRCFEPVSPLLGSQARSPSE